MTRLDLWSRDISCVAEITMCAYAIQEDDCAIDSSAGNETTGDEFGLQSWVFNPCLLVT